MASFAASAVEKPNPGRIGKVLEVHVLCEQLDRVSG
jgi:hypothetical protein